MPDIATIWGVHRNDPKFHTHHSFWEDAIERRPDCKLTRYLWTEMLDMPKSHDLYLFIDFNPALYAIPKGRYKNTAAYWWDSHHTSQAIVLQVADTFDRCYFAEHASAILARTYGYPVTWLPPAFHPEVFHPMPERPKVHDYAFVGQRDNHVFRVGDSKLSFLQKLGQAEGIHGYVGAGVYGHDVNGIYNDAKVLFERTIFQSVGTRFFEVIGSGGFTLMNRLRQFSGIELLATDGVHYVSFDDSYADFEAKLRYYLAHDEERERIAKAGHAWFLERHTYARRLERILIDFNLVT